MKTCIILFFVAFIVLGIYALARISTISERRAAKIAIKREENTNDNH